MSILGTVTVNGVQRPAVCRRTLPSYGTTGVTYQPDGATAPYPMRYRKAPLDVALTFHANTADLDAAHAAALDEAPQHVRRPLTVFGWDGASNPIVCYSDEYHLPRHLQTFVPAAERIAAGIRVTR